MKKTDGYVEFGYFSEQPYSQTPFATITNKELEEIGQDCRLIVNLGSDYQHIKKAAKRFNELRRLPRYSDLLVIGLFSIIEMLVSYSDPAGISKIVSPNKA